MQGVGEEIDGLHAGDRILFSQSLQVACLRGRIATYIHNQRCFHVEYLLHEFIVHTGARRIGDDHIGSSVLIEKSIVTNIDHITGEKFGVFDVVALGIDPGIVDRRSDQFHAD